MCIITAKRTGRSVRIWLRECADNVLYGCKVPMEVISQTKCKYYTDDARDISSKQVILVNGSQMSLSNMREEMTGWYACLYRSLDVRNWQWQLNALSLIGVDVKYNASRDCILKPSNWPLSPVCQFKCE